MTRLDFTKEKKGFTPVTGKWHGGSSAFKFIISSMHNIFRPVLRVLTRRHSKAMSFSVRGFTLIELLVVISIISLLSSVVLASLRSGREKAQIAAGQQFSGQAYRTLGSDAVFSLLFDESNNTDTNVYDSSGNNLHASWVSGTALNRSTTDRPINSGKSLILNATCVRAGNSMSPIMSVNDFTFSVWVKPTSANSSTIFRSELTTDTSVIFLLQMSGSSIVSVWYGYPINGTGGFRIYGTNIPISQWTHFAYTRKGTLNQLYINGKQVDQNTNTWSNSGGTYQLRYFSVGGCYSMGGSGVFVGLLDDLHILGGSLSASEIYNIYAKGAEERGIAVIE